MKIFSLKALGASLLTLGLVFAGVALPAQAATMTSPSATSTGTIGTSGTNTSPITVTATSVSAQGSGQTLVEFYSVELPSGWTFASTPSGQNCNNYSQFFTYSGVTATNGCAVSNTDSNNSGKPTLTFFTTGIPAQSTIQVTFQTGFLNVNTARTFSLKTTYTDFSTVDSVSATLGGAPASYTVTFDANGGTGTTSAQTASSSAALTSNGFSKSGFNFAGWNTAADGSGTAFADGASYAFSSSLTLYAQWTATLANTGVNTATGISLFAGGVSLAAVGAGMIFIVRRKVQ